MWKVWKVEEKHGSLRHGQVLLAGQNSAVPASELEVVLRLELSC